MNMDNSRENDIQQLARATRSAKNSDYETAIVQLKSLLSEYPHHELATGMLAAIYLQIGMHQKASIWYRKLLALKPENSLARFQLGMTRLAQGMTAEAIDTWHPLLSIEDEFMAHFHSGLALLQLEHNDEAYALLTQAYQTMPCEHPLYPELVRLLSESDSPSPEVHPK